MARKVLTDIGIRALKPGPIRREIPDPGQRGLYIQVQPTGRKGYAVRFRFNRRPRKLTLPAGLTLAQARKLASEVIFSVAQGIDPGHARKATEAKAARLAANTVEAVCREYLAREGKKLRSVDQRAAVLARLVYPRIGGRPIADLKRSEVVRLLDDVEDKRGPAMADMVLAVLRRIMSWHAARDDDFRVPIVRGMARTRPKERARSRILTDDELRAVWAAASTAKGPFPAMIRFLLLTGARRTEASAMTWSEVDGTDWLLPASRNKVKVDLLRPLSEPAQDILAALPRFADCPYIFTGDGRRPIVGFGKAKRGLDAACGVSGWRLHDLRRTARSLMSRAGVSTDVAERCLGHVIGGVRGVYDRYEYRDEKARAFAALAAQIERIVNPQDNVVVLRS